MVDKAPVRRLAAEAALGSPTSIDARPAAVVVGGFCWVSLLGHRRRTASRSPERVCARSRADAITKPRVRDQQVNANYYEGDGGDDDDDSDRRRHRRSSHLYRAGRPPG